jgi:LPPG:FO 2-phospho-L-lactate transferase
MDGAETLGDRTILALCGGVGGAKLALGLARRLNPGQLVIVVNTGDDFEHLGLRVCPDLDTVMYTLAGLDNPDTGWGVRGETWQFMQALGRFGAETWFRLGDQDMATHVERSRRLRAGETLTQVTATLCRALGIAHKVLPMSDDPVATVVECASGALPFQHYFVRERCEPPVHGVSYAGAAQARPRPELLALLRNPALAAVVICPSNPFLSIEPILAVGGVREAIEACRAPIVAVSPIVGGQAIKGPTAKMMREMGFEPSAAAVARRYGTLLDGFLLDTVDAGLRTEVEALGIAMRSAPTVMRTPEDRLALADCVIRFALELAVRA